MTSDILSIGEAMAELSCTGELQRATHFVRDYAGDTFNTAVAAARLGSTVTFLTRQGQDAFAYGLQEMLLQEGIQIASTRPSPQQTGLYLVAVDEKGERQFTYYRQNSAASELSVDDIRPNVIENCKILYASGITMAISESSKQATLKAFKIAREAGVMTAFDPNYRAALWPSTAHAVDALNEILPWVDVFLPSFPYDIVSLLTFKKPEQMVEFFLYKGVKLVVAKVADQGCYLGFKKEIEHYPAPTVHVVDTTGAGDAFNGGFLHGLSRGEALSRCAQFGLATAALKIVKPGSARAMPTRDSVYSQMPKV
jgi:2-dehydro-3-deoxygluconokinase